MNKDSDKKTISEAAAAWVLRRDGGLSGPETAEFEQWLAADTRHETALEHYTRAWSLINRPLPTGGQGALVRELQFREKRRRARRMRVAAAGAFGAVAIFLAALWQWPREGVELQPSQPLTLAAGAMVVRPEQRVLEDGSTVELRQGAVIDVRYDDAVRRVVLASGEAHFQVTKGSTRPFVVVAGGMEVRAVGTAFAVGLGAEQVEVLVTEGRVAVEKTPLENTDAPSAGDVTPGMTAFPLTMLDASERIVVKTASALPGSDVAPEAPVVTLVTPDEINERLAWRVSILEFSATPLAEAVALVNRHSRLPDGSANTRLVLDESLSGMKAEPVSGYFPASDIEAFVRVLAVSMGIENERHGDVIVLRKK